MHDDFSRGMGLLAFDFETPTGGESFTGNESVRSDRPLLRLNFGEFRGFVRLDARLAQR
jgi:hypothetical protein